MFFYDLSRTFFETFHTARAFRVIEDGEIVHHRDRAVGAGPRAQSATYATDFAHGHRLFAFAGGRARAVYFCGRGDAFDYQLRAFLHAGAAGSAQSLVHKRDPVFDFDSAHGAHFGARSAAQTAVRTHLATAEVHLFVEAPFVADIFVFVGAVYAAVALDDRDGGFAGREFDPGKLRNDLLFFVGRDFAIVERRFAAGEAFCKTFATAVSATAAVGAGEMFEYLDDFFVLLDMAHLGDDQDENGKDDGKRGDYSQHQTDFVPLDSST